jgi:hypothetical protein
VGSRAPLAAAGEAFTLSDYLRLAPMLTCRCALQISLHLFEDNYFSTKLIQKHLW